jgi:hypothetical protein
MNDEWRRFGPHPGNIAGRRNKGTGNKEQGILK